LHEHIASATVAAPIIHSQHRQELILYINNKSWHPSNQKTKCRLVAWTTQRLI
jgi:hypothetical protein